MKANFQRLDCAFVENTLDFAVPKVGPLNDPPEQNRIEIVTRPDSKIAPRSTAQFGLNARCTLQQALAESKPAFIKRSQMRVEILREIREEREAHSEICKRWIIQHNAGQIQPKTAWQAASADSRFGH